MPVRAAPKPRPSIVSHIAGEDLLRLYSDACPNYKRIADLTKLSKSDLSKISRVAGSSVRFDAHIPEPVAERLREIANIANLVGVLCGRRAKSCPLVRNSQSHARQHITEQPDSYR
jgi:hypothetical protein